MFSRVLDYLSGLLCRYLPFPRPPFPSTREALVDANVQTPVKLSWLNQDALNQFIARGSMETYEKDLHEAGEILLLKLVTERLLVGREEEDDFIINVDERMIKDSSLDICSTTDRKVFEFEMPGKDKTHKTFVGKQFMLLVREGKDEKKEVRKRNISDRYKRVLREFHIWHKLRESSNFVQLLHISFDDGKSITAVLENFHKDLRHSLSTPGIDFVTIIKGIAKGLDFLHKFTEAIHIDGLQNVESAPFEKVTGIAHSDVKCANVLLRENSSIPYLTDFGVSHQLIQGTFTKMFETSGVYAIGTLPWMPPELLLAPDKKSESEPKVNYTTESDVWSFGMTIYEIVSSGDPWAQDVTNGLRDAAAIQGKIIEAMKISDLPKWPASDGISQPLQSYSDRLCDLRDQCCKYVPGERLTMEKVVNFLDTIFVQ